MKGHKNEIGNNIEPHIGHSFSEIRHTNSLEYCGDRKLEHLE